jgi:hypothetical protein
MSLKDLILKFLDVAKDLKDQIVIFIKGAL